MAERKKRKRKSKEKIVVMSTKTVTTSVVKGEETELVTKEVEVFDVDPAYVSVKAGVTRSLAQYEFLRVDVSIMMPCYKEMVNETYEAIADQVSEMLENEVEQYISTESDNG